jgi:hypothetical protein
MISEMVLIIQLCSDYAEPEDGSWDSSEENECLWNLKNFTRTLAVLVREEDCPAVPVFCWEMRIGQLHWLL